MELALIPALAAYAFAMSITPGPNNLMLMASGANFGIRRTVPHMLGVSIGFAVLAIAVGLGLGALFERVPALYTALKVAAVIYMLWLAWKIANAAAPKGPVEAGTPMTFLQAVLFQWVNPKAVAMAVTAVTVYAPGGGLAGLLAVAVIFSAVNLPSVGSWALVGVKMRSWLSTPGRLRAFNWTMAALLLLSLVPVLAH